MVDALTHSQGPRVGVVCCPGEDLSAPNSPSPSIFRVRPLPSDLHGEPHQTLTCGVCSSLRTCPSSSKFCDGGIHTSAPWCADAGISLFGHVLYDGNRSLMPLGLSLPVGKGEEEKLPGTFFSSCLGGIGLCCLQRFLVQWQKDARCVS